MNLSQQGLAMIEGFEGFRGTAYQDQGGVWTIGFGHTGNDVYAGQMCTWAEAQDWLASDTQKAQDCVNRRTQGLPIFQYEFDALVSFTFNLGCGALSGSELLKKFIAGDVEGAAAEFPKWNHIGKVENAGLTARRAKEADVFLHGYMRVSDVQSPA